MCRYLISSDGNGINDPLLAITCVEDTKLSSTKYETINAIWNENLIFDIVSLQLNKKSTWPILLAEVYNKKNKPDNLIGSSYVWLIYSPYKYKNTELIKPKWHQLYLPKSNAP